MKNLFNLRSLLFIALSLLLGICIGYFVFIGKILGLIISVSILLLLFLAVFLFNSQFAIKTRSVIAIIMALFCAFGATNFTLRLNNFENENLIGGRTMSVKGKIVESVVYSNYQVYTLKELEFLGANSFETNYRLKLSVYNTQKDKSYGVGDIVAFSCNVFDMPVIYNSKFSANNIVNKIKYTASVNFEEIAKQGFYQNIFECWAFNVKSELSSGLGENECALATALLLGDTSLISSDVLSNFRASGVAHVFAVSGLHIGFLTAMLLFILKRIKLNGLIKTLIISVVIFLYSGTCGFSPSSIRACITCSIMLFARHFALKYDGLSALSFSAIVLLIISPFNLFDVGFLLSYITVFGILILYNPFNRLFVRVKPLKLKNALSLTLSAFLSSTPIVAYYFSNFSLLGILTNLIFVPIVSVVFTILFFFVILALIFGAQSVFLFTPSILIKALIWVFSTVDFSVFVLSLNGLNGSIFLYYFALILAGDLVNISRRTKILGALLLVGLCVACVFIFNNLSKNQNKAYFTENSGFGAVLFTSGDNASLVLVGEENKSAYKTISNLLEVSGVNEINELIVCLKSSTGLIYSTYDLTNFKELLLLDESEIDVKVLENYLGVQTSLIINGQTYSFSMISLCYDSALKELKINAFDRELGLFYQSLSSGIFDGFVPNENAGVFKYIFAK